MPPDRATLSAIGHAGLPFCSPVPVVTLDALLDRLADLPAAWATHARGVGLARGRGFQRTGSVAPRPPP